MLQPSQFNGRNGEPDEPSPRPRRPLRRCLERERPCSPAKGHCGVWDPDGAHYVRTLEARGFDALEKRITGAYEKNVGSAGHRFRAAPNAQALRNVVTFNWEMVSADGCKVLAVGLEFLVLDERGSIVADYQFMVA